MNTRERVKMPPVLAALSVHLEAAGLEHRHVRHSGISAWSIAVPAAGAYVTEGTDRRLNVWDYEHRLLLSTSQPGEGLPFYDQAVECLQRLRQLWPVVAVLTGYHPLELLPRHGVRLSRDASGVVRLDDLGAALHAAGDGTWLRLSHPARQILAAGDGAPPEETVEAVLRLRLYRSLASAVLSAHGDRTAPPSLNAVRQWAADPDAQGVKAATTRLLGLLKHRRVRHRLHAAAGDLGLEDVTVVDLPDAHWRVYVTGRCSFVLDRCSNGHSGSDGYSVHAQAGAEAMADAVGQEILQRDQVHGISPVAATDRLALEFDAAGLRFTAWHAERKYSFSIDGPGGTVTVEIPDAGPLRLAKSEILLTHTRSSAAPIVSGPHFHEIAEWVAERVRDPALVPEDDAERGAWEDARAIAAGFAARFSGGAPTPDRWAVRSWPRLAEIGEEEARERQLGLARAVAVVLKRGGSPLVPIPDPPPGFKVILLLVADKSRRVFVTRRHGIVVQDAETGESEWFGEGYWGAALAALPEKGRAAALASYLREELEAGKHQFTEASTEDGFPVLELRNVRFRVRDGIVAEPVDRLPELGFEDGEPRGGPDAPWALLWPGFVRDFGSDHSWAARWLDVSPMVRDFIALADEAGLAYDHHRSILTPCGQEYFVRYRGGDVRWVLDFTPAGYRLHGAHRECWFQRDNPAGVVASVQKLVEMVAGAKQSADTIAHLVPTEKVDDHGGRAPEWLQILAKGLVEYFGDDGEVSIHWLAGEDRLRLVAMDLKSDFHLRVRDNRRGPEHGFVMNQNRGPGTEAENLAATGSGPCCWKGAPEMGASALKQALAWIKAARDARGTGGDPLAAARSWSTLTEGEHPTLALDSDAVAEWCQKVVRRLVAAHPNHVSDKNKAAILGLPESAGSQLALWSRAAPFLEALRHGFRKPVQHWLDTGWTDYAGLNDALAALVRDGDHVGAVLQRARLAAGVPVQRLAGMLGSTAEAVRRTEESAVVDPAEVRAWLGSLSGLLSLQLTGALAAFAELARRPGS